MKRMALYEAEDDSHLLTAETEFGSQCNLVFDSIITQIEWRFEAMSAVSSDFDILSGHSLSKSSVDELKKKAANLSQIYKADLDSIFFSCPKRKIGSVRPCQFLLLKRTNLKTFVVSARHKELKH